MVTLRLPSVSMSGNCFLMQSKFINKLTHYCADEDEDGVKDNE